MRLNSNINIWLNKLNSALSKSQLKITYQQAQPSKLAQQRLKLRKQQRQNLDRFIRERPQHIDKQSQLSRKKDRIKSKLKLACKENQSNTQRVPTDSVNAKQQRQKLKNFIHQQRQALRENNGQSENYVQDRQVSLDQTSFNTNRQQKTHTLAQETDKIQTIQKQLLKGHANQQQCVSIYGVGSFKQEKLEQQDNLMPQDEILNKQKDRTSYLRNTEKQYSQYSKQDQNMQPGQHYNCQISESDKQRNKTFNDHQISNGYVNQQRFQKYGNKNYQQQKELEHKFQNQNNFIANTQQFLNNENQRELSQEQQQIQQSVLQKYEYFFRGIGVPQDQLKSQRELQKDVQPNDVIENQINRDSFVRKKGSTTKVQINTDENILERSIDKFSNNLSEQSKNNLINQHSITYNSPQQQFSKIQQCKKLPTEISLQEVNQKGQQTQTQTHRNGNLENNATNTAVDNSNQVMKRALNNFNNEGLDLQAISEKQQEQNRDQNNKQGSKIKQATDRCLIQNQNLIKNLFGQSSLEKKNSQLQESETPLKVQTANNHLDLRNYNNLTQQDFQQHKKYHEKVQGNIENCIQLKGSLDKNSATSSQMLFTQNSQAKSFSSKKSKLNNQIKQNQLFNSHINQGQQSTKYQQLPPKTQSSIKQIHSNESLTHGIQNFIELSHLVNPAKCNTLSETNQNIQRLQSQQSQDNQSTAFDQQASQQRNLQLVKSNQVIISTQGSLSDDISQVDSQRRKLNATQNNQKQNIQKSEDSLQYLLLDEIQKELEDVKQLKQKAQFIDNKSIQQKNWFDGKGNQNISPHFDNQSSHISKDIQNKIYIPKQDQRFQFLPCYDNEKIQNLNRDLVHKQNQQQDKQVRNDWQHTTTGLTQQNFKLKNKNIQQDIKIKLKLPHSQVSLEPSKSRNPITKEIKIATNNKRQIQQTNIRDTVDFERLRKDILKPSIQLNQNNYKYNSNNNNNFAQYNGFKYEERDQLQSQLVPNLISQKTQDQLSPQLASSQGNNLWEPKVSNPLTIYQNKQKKTAQDDISQNQEIEKHCQQQKQQQQLDLTQGQQRAQSLNHATQQRLGNQDDVSFQNIKDKGEIVPQNQYVNLNQKHNNNDLITQDNYMNRHQPVKEDTQVQNYQISNYQARQTKYSSPYTDQVHKLIPNKLDYHNQQNNHEVHYIDASSKCDQMNSQKQATAIIKNQDKLQQAPAIQHQQNQNVNQLEFKQRIRPKDYVQNKNQDFPDSQNKQQYKTIPQLQDACIHKINQFGNNNENRQFFIPFSSKIAYMKSKRKKGIPQKLPASIKKNINQINEKTPVNIGSYSNNKQILQMRKESVHSHNGKQFQDPIKMHNNNNNDTRNLKGHLRQNNQDKQVRKNRKQGVCENVQGSSSDLISDNGSCNYDTQQISNFLQDNSQRQFMQKTSNSTQSKQTIIAKLPPIANKKLKKSLSNQLQGDKFNTLQQYRDSFQSINPKNVHVNESSILNSIVKLDQRYKNLAILSEGVVSDGY